MGGGGPPLIAANSGWTLQEANAINDNGQIVVYGINPSGNQEAFLLTPIQVPEPATWSLLGLGFLAVLGTRRLRGGSL